MLRSAASVSTVSILTSRSDEVDDPSLIPRFSTPITPSLGGYCALGASDDIFHINLNAYSQFIEDYELDDAESTHCKQAHWDQLFVSVDASPSSGSKGGAEEHNRKKALNRQEWMQVMVKGAVMRYVLPGDMSSVPAAVAKMFDEVISPRADPLVFAPPNAFRAVIYVQEVDSVLRNHEASLRLLFMAMCDLKPVTMENNGLANKLATYANWRELLRAFSMVDRDCSDRDATLCFSWAKMLTTNEQETRARIKMTHLSFEDFLESLCRLAVLKALPTNDELAEAECDEACTYLLHQAAEKPAVHADFLRSRRVAWGHLPEGEMADVQPVWRKVELLIEWLIVLCQGGLDRREGEKMALEEKQVRRLLKSRNK